MDVVHSVGSHHPCCRSFFLSASFPEPWERGRLTVSTESSDFVYINSIFKEGPTSVTLN